MNLGPRETATILAALRLMQEHQVLGTLPARIQHIAAGHGQFEAMQEHEVHELGLQLAGVTVQAPARALPRSPIELMAVQA